MISRAYRKLKINQKFTIAILVAILIPYALLASIFSGKLYGMIVADTIKDAQNASAATAPMVSGIVDDITEKNVRLSSSAYYKNIFYSTGEKSFFSLPDTMEATEFRGLVENFQSDGVNVRVYMGIPSTYTFFTSDNSKDIFLPISEAKGTYWYGIFQGKHVSKLYCPSAYLSHNERDNLGDCAYISYMTVYMSGEIYPCYLALYYQSDLFKNILQENMTFSGGVSYIINEREEIVASTDAALSSTYRLGFSEIEHSLMSSNSFITKNILGSTVYVAFYYIDEPNWFLVTVIPEAPLIEQSNQFLLRFAIITVLCVILGLIMAWLQSWSITSRISKVIRQMSQVRHGPPVALDEPATEDEVGELINTYNYMANEMQHLIEQEQRAAENLRFAEFNALQAQINPHFLYNTMDMINWMAKEGRTDEVSEIVQRLSRFYKLTLSRKNASNSIADELEHVTIYVELQNMRHGNPIDFVVDMPDELTNFTIPKLTLQPIVENAIIHGILEKDSKSGTIIITGWEEDDDIVILVSDDGVGIPADKINDILKALPSGPSKGSNVAVSNIHQRLKLLSGEDYGLSYSSTEGQGTEVTIRIPKLIG